MPSEKVDMTAGWMAGMDRKIRKEEAVEETIKNFIVMGQHDSQLAENDEFISEAARTLIEKLKQIDNGKT